MTGLSWQWMPRAWWGPHMEPWADGRAKNCSRDVQLSVRQGQIELQERMPPGDLSFRVKIHAVVEGVLA